MQRRYANGAGQQEKRTGREKLGLEEELGAGGMGLGGVDNFVVQQQRTGTRGLPTGQGVWRKSGILGGTTGETAQRLPHAIRGQAARPAQQEVCRRRDEGVGSPHPHPHPLPSPPPSPFPLPSPPHRHPPFHPPPIAIPPPTHPGSPGPPQLASPPPVQHPAICGRVAVSIGLGLDNDIHADSAASDLARSWSVPASYSATPHPIPLQPFSAVPRRRVWRRRPGPRTAAMGAHQIAQRRAVQTTAAKARQDGPDRDTHGHWWAAR